MAHDLVHLSHWWSTESEEVGQAASRESRFDSLRRPTWTSLGKYNYLWMGSWK